MSEWVYLDQTEIVPGRPFTGPDKSLEDVNVLQYMLGRLQTILNQPPELQPGRRPWILQLPETDGRLQRIVVVDPNQLAQGRQDLTVVGFFGQKRPDADPALIAEFDVELIDEFSRHPGMLSYSSLQLKCGNWGNLVLFDQPETKQRWGASERHAYVARELAPKYYVSIRLHNGLLPGGLVPAQPPVLLRTKYFDFGGGGWWQAVRELQAPPAARPDGVVS